MRPSLSRRCLSFARALSSAFSSGDGKGSTTVPTSLPRFAALIIVSRRNSLRVWSCTCTLSVGGGSEIPKRIHSDVRAFFRAAPPTPTTVLRRGRTSSPPAPFPSTIRPCPSGSRCSVFKNTPAVSGVRRTPSFRSRRRWTRGVCRPSVRDRHTDIGSSVDANVAATVTTTSRRHEMQLAARRIRWMCLLCACALADQRVDVPRNDTQTGSTSFSDFHPHSQSIPSGP